ncbi:MAG: serine/threonine protein kinase [Planctomycetaceae bacterium]|nr:serine/threonine protein kinase [Planctomycetaceae bacterium]
MWDDSTTTLTALAEILEEFIERWEACDGVTPPTLSGLVPGQGEARRITLIELIKIDLEYRWLKHNFPRKMEEYISDFPELHEDGLPIDLLYEEFHIRRQSGLNVDPEEFLVRFPEQASELARLLGISSSHHSTSLGRGLKPRQLPEFRPGQQIDEFDLLAFLGKGAFAQVFLARQRSMQRLVALKVSADYGTEPQTLAQLDHDHIVRVYDVRSVPEKKVQLLYMQYLPGGTLQGAIEVLKQTPEEDRTGRVLLRGVDRSLDARGETAVDSPNRRQFAAASWSETVCAIGAKLARALDYAHRHGVLHRDVKPANVLLTADAVPKLADFNISFSSEVIGATPEAFFGGSLAYMSPEQLEAFSPAHPRTPDSLDGRADLYSLGILLWELLTGRRPFHDHPFRGDWTKTLEAMLSERNLGVTTDMRSQLRKFPPGLLRVLTRCLAPQRADRWQTGDELARQLELCARPDAETLLYPTYDSPRVRMRRWAVPLVIAFAMLPNLLATVFNITYNFLAMIQQGDEKRKAAFNIAVGSLNTFVYPLGLGILGWLAWTVVRGIKLLKRGDPVANDLQAQLRARALKLGHAAAVIGSVLWCISGVIFPVIIHMLDPRESPPYLHYLASLVLCGLIAAAYPFYIITIFGVRVLYPGLKPAESGWSSDVSTNEQVSRMSVYYLLMAAAVPLLAVATLAVGMAVEGKADRYKAISLSVLGVGGFVGVLLLYPVFRLLQRELETLHRVSSTDAQET